MIMNGLNLLMIMPIIRMCFSANFLLCTTVNYHQTTIWEDVFLLFPSILSKSKVCEYILVLSVQQTSGNSIVDSWILSLHSCCFRLTFCDVHCWHAPPKNIPKIKFFAREMRIIQKTATVCWGISTTWWNMMNLWPWSGEKNPWESFWEAHPPEKTPLKRGTPTWEIAGGPFLLRDYVNHQLLGFGKVGGWGVAG